MSEQEIGTIGLHGPDAIDVMSNQCFHLVIRIARGVESARFNGEERHRSVKQSRELGKSLHPATQPRYENARSRTTRPQFDERASPIPRIGYDHSLDGIVHAIDIPYIEKCTI